MLVMSIDGVKKSDFEPLYYPAIQNELNVPLLYLTVYGWLKMTWPDHTAGDYNSKQFFIWVWADPND